MSKQRKAKKPARIRGTICIDLEDNKWLSLPIDNPEALVEQVARAIHGGSWTFDVGEDDSREHYYESARAALRSIGVPLKKGLIK